MRRAPRSSIPAPDFVVREVKVRHRRSLARRLDIAWKKLRKREGLPADLFSLLNVPPARIATCRFATQHAREMEIHSAECRCDGSQSSAGRSRDRRELVGAI